jgi:hypothetical protein
MFVLVAGMITSCSTDAIVAPIPGSIQGVVKHPTTRSPLPNVNVSVSSGSAPVLTDERGYYRFDGITSGDHTLNALYTERDYVCYATVPVHVDADRTTTADILMREGSSSYLGVIAGRIIDEAGNPVQGASITIEPGRATAISAADGTFVLTEITPDDSITIDARTSSSYARVGTRTESGKITRITITLGVQDPLKGWMQGTVTSRGEPVPGAIVRITKQGLLDSTDEQGRYHIPNIPPGRHEVQFSRDGFPSRTFVVSVAGNGATKNVSLSPQQLVPTEDLELYLPLDGSIEDRSPKCRAMMMQGLSGADTTLTTFTHNRFGTPEEALVMDGTRCIVTVDDINMNLKPITVGMRFYVHNLPSTARYLIGKTSDLKKDGFYITLSWVDVGNIDRNMNLYIVSDSGRSVMKYNVHDDRVEERRWIWVGYSVAEDGSGYIAVEGITYKLPDIKGLISNQSAFSIGGLGAGGLNNSIDGLIDHVVVYSRYKTFDELKAIMEAKD